MVVMSIMEGVSNRDNIKTCDPPSPLVNIFNRRLPGLAALLNKKCRWNERREATIFEVAAKPCQATVALTLLQ